MTTFVLILLVFLCFPSISLGQTCDCESSFLWVKQTIEDNDAGFSYSLRTKGHLEYETHNRIYGERVKTINAPLECHEALAEWLTFFRPGHLSISLLEQVQSQPSQLSDEEIKRTFENWDKVEFELPTFKNYLQSKKDIDLEGIWVSGPYRVGVRKVDEGYIGFIIEADGIYWSKGMIKFRIHPDNSSTLYMRDHSERKYKHIDLLANTYIKMGTFELNRSFPVLDVDPSLEEYSRMMSSDRPFLKELDDNTLLLRIPRFWRSEKEYIDGVILTNKDRILQTKNLIIDVRDNSGGADASFQEILPLIYTNPIRTIGVEYYSTKLNNQRMLDFLSKPEYDFKEDDKKWIQEAYDKLSAHLGEFVDLDPSPVTIKTLDTIYPYPENVGIIINENNGSTTEQFLLSAKQSRKVKLFGTTTMGVLDISNMYFVTSPSREFRLGYCLSKSKRIPEMTIDGKGIQPDYYIDKSIPKHKWIDFVSNTLNGK